MPFNKSVLLKDASGNGHWIGEARVYRNGSWKLERIIGHVPQSNLENFRGKFGTKAAFRNDEPMNWKEFRSGRHYGGEHVKFDESGSETFDE